MNKVWQEKIATSKALKGFANLRGQIIAPYYGEEAQKRAWPTIVNAAWGLADSGKAVILIIFGGVLVIRSARAGGHRLDLSAEKARTILGRPGNRRLLLTAALTIGYAGVLLGRVPYQLATGLFIFIFVFLFEWEPGLPPTRSARIVAVAAILAILTTGLVSWVFERLFLVTLP